MLRLPRVERRRAIAAVLAAIAAAACGGCGATSALRQGPPGSTRVTIFQDQVHVLSDPAPTLDTLRSLGATEVRIFLSWDAIAPDPASRLRPSGLDAASPAAYAEAGWAPYDRAVRDATARGMGVYFLLTGPAPLWATRPAAPGTPSHDPNVYEPSARQFADFVQAVGRRYDGSYTPAGSSSPLPKVDYWGIWDEPNYGYQLAPQALGGVEVAPKIYRGLLDGAWAALHSTGHGNDTILIGETAPRGANVPGVANGMVPLRFLRALYCVSSGYRELRGMAASDRGCPPTAAASRGFRAQNPALFEATGFAAHLYTPGQVAPPGLLSPPNEPDYAGLTDLPKLERTLDRLNLIYGSRTRFPVYNTEFGFQTDPPRSACGCVFLSPATAAYYLNWAEYITWSNPRLRSDAQYLLYDAPVPGDPTESSFSSGLLFDDGTPKADYGAFRLPIFLPVTTTRRGRSLEVWGDVRPAPYAERDTGSRQHALIQFQPGPHAAWTTLGAVTITSSSGYFEVPVKFPRSGSVRLRWTYPATYAFLPRNTPRTVTSRVQTVKVG